MNGEDINAPDFSGRTINELNELTASVSPFERAEAAMELGRRKDSGAFERLEKLFRGEEVLWVKARILQAIRELGGDMARGFIFAHVNDPEPRIRGSAIAALAEMEDPEAIPVFLKAIQDADEMVRFDGAVGLAIQNRVEAVQPLLTFLENSDLRMLSLVWLTHLGHASSREGLQKVFRKWFLPHFERLQAAAALMRLGDQKGQEYVLKELESRKPTRVQAIDILGEYGSGEHLQKLCAIASNPRDDDRGVAVQVLASRHYPDNLPELMRAMLLKDPDPEIRTDAAEALVNWNDPVLAAVLDEAIASERDPDVRRAMKEAAAELRAGGPGASGEKLNIN
ncbi:MAG: hypothetical protein GMKNLPBB_02923 [Myxococcota bacterium]|nr:hypothetical protein [Myxococcota bacterium]